MIWLVVALLAVFIVGFFIYFFVIRFNNLERHGSVGVPGDSVIDLPAGQIKVYYQDAQRFRYSEEPAPWTGFSMLVSAEDGGERIDLGPAPETATYKVRGKTRIPYATLDLPRAGRYRIVSQIDPEAIEPRITFC